MRGKTIILLVTLLILMLAWDVEARRHRHRRKSRFPIFNKIKRAFGRIGRKLLDRPPKHRSRFDKYPIFILRYHQFIWHRFFARYLNHVNDGRPTLPRTNCWTIRCWMKRNSFKRYWKWRAPIKAEGKNSSPFLHRRCRIPNMKRGRCRSEHLRHDYFWRMFMWIGRYGFPKPSVRKRICITDWCRHEQFRWRRYWKNFFLYTSLVPVLRPYDFNWRMWNWRYAGNIPRLQQVVYPALAFMGLAQGNTMIMGGMTLNQVGRYMTPEMKMALVSVMQQDMERQAAVMRTAQFALQQQRSALMMVMQMPAYPSQFLAQSHMQQAMGGMYAMQNMQQARMQAMMSNQIWAMARYLRGYCGCGTCQGRAGYPGMSAGMGGPSYYVRQSGTMSQYQPGMFGAGGGPGMTNANQQLYYNIRSPMELKMRVQALYARNNLPAYA